MYFCSRKRVGVVKREQSGTAAEKKRRLKETERKRKEKIGRGGPIQRIPETILGATDASGQLELLMKWRGVEECELIPAKEANLKWPQIVIQFYEKHISWGPLN